MHRPRSTDTNPRIAKVIGRVRTQFNRWHLFMVLSHIHTHILWKAEHPIPHASNSILIALHVIHATGCMPCLVHMASCGTDRHGSDQLWMVTLTVMLDIDLRHC